MKSMILFPGLLFFSIAALAGSAHEETPDFLYLTQSGIEIEGNRLTLEEKASLSLTPSKELNFFFWDSISFRR